MTHVDLFSGIGGFALAAQRAGFRTVVFCEINPYCQKVLRKHWPGVPIHDDIRTFNWPLADGKGGRRSRGGISTRSRAAGKGKAYARWRSPITLLTGGFPCQPFSVAGKRRGAEDDRFLWPEMVRVISEVRPTWVVAENVTGFIDLGLDRAISDLEGQGYETEPYHIPACAVAAPHERRRIFLVGHSKRGGQHRNDRGGAGKKPSGGRSAIPVPKGAGLEVGDRPSRTKVGLIRVCRWTTEPHVGRVAYGVPDRVDRIEALGNAIVPQVAFEIIKAIADIEKERLKP